MERSGTAGGRGKTKKESVWTPFGFGSPCWTRTSDTLINSQVLVPTELRRNVKLWFLRQSGARIRLRIFRHELRRNIKCKRSASAASYYIKSRETYSVSLDCVGYELSSRAVASQVFSPLQRLTSVFGMGTGGPTALK